MTTRPIPTLPGNLNLSPRDTRKLIAMLDKERELARDDPTDAAGKLLAKLEADEPGRQRSIARGFSEMAAARAELLASPLYADDPTALERRLSALDAARRSAALSVEQDNEPIGGRQ